MSKPIIQITNFSAGVLSDATENVTNGGQAFVNCNIHHTDSTLQASQKLTQETDVFTDLVKWFCYDENEATYKYWALGDTGNLYKTTAIGGTWELHGNVGGHGNGLRTYNGERFYTNDTALSGSGGTSKTLDSDNLWHPMQTYLGSLFIGAGRYVAKLESDGTFTARALTLPDGHRVKSLEVYGDRLVIGTWQGTNIYDLAQAYIFTWDGTTTFPEQSYYLEEHGSNALITWENILMNFAGIQGNLYVFNNSFLDKAKSIPNVDIGVGDYVFVNPGAVAQYGGNILAGVSVGSGSAIGGVMEFGRRTEDLPFAMTTPYTISTGYTDVEIGAIFTGESNKFLVSWERGAVYGVDRLDTTTKKTGGYFTSQNYEVLNGAEQRLVQGLAIVAEPLGDCSITIAYDADNSGTFTAGGTIDEDNQDDILYFPFRAKVAQFKTTLVTDLNNSPIIKRIDIF